MITRQIPKITASNSIIQQLVDCSKKYPVNGWEFEYWPYGQIFANAEHNTQALRIFLRDLKEVFDKEGYVILDLSILLENYSEPEAASSSTYLLSVLGNPFRIFQNQPGHWRKLGVDLNRPPNRSGGTGPSALHMDFVNAANPPDIVCLFTIRHDPTNGGESIISSLDEIEQELLPNNVEVLSIPQYTDGVVVNLSGVGEDINPFPVFNFNSRWKYRFTGNLLSSAPNEEARNALVAMSKIIQSREVSFLLKRGEMLILNQHRVLHGRKPLGNGQEIIPLDQRRFLLHSFVRTS